MKNKLNNNIVVQIYLFLLIFFSFFLISTNGQCEKNNARLYIHGLSLLVPPGENWTYEIIHPGRIEFAKIENNELKSFLASAYIHKIPIATNDFDFLKKVTDVRWAGKTSQTRFKNFHIKEHITHEKEDICIRYHTKYEDSESKYLSKNISHLVIEDIGLICRYPGTQDIGISIGISQRAEPDKLSTNFEEIADNFLANFKFEPMNNSTSK